MIVSFINRKLKKAVAEVRSEVEGLCTGKVKLIMHDFITHFGCSVETTFQFDSHRFSLA